LSEIYPRVGIPKSTTHRILATLTKGGLLGYDVTEERYSVGPALFALGSLYLTTNNLQSVAGPVLRAINDLTEESPAIAVLDEKGNITFVMREESKHALKVGFRVGLSSPAFAHALGKALLSELTDDEIDILYPEEKLPPLTNKTVPTRTHLKRELEEIRKTGVAYVDEQALEGVEAVAALIRDQHGKAVAAVAIGVPAVRMNESRREIFAEMVKLGAALINYRLGYQAPSVSIRNLEDLRSGWERLNA